MRRYFHEPERASSTKTWPVSVSFPVRALEAFLRADHESLAGRMSDGPLFDSKSSGPAGGGTQIAEKG